MNRLVSLVLFGAVLIVAISVHPSKTGAARYTGTSAWQDSNIYYDLHGFSIEDRHPCKHRSRCRFKVDWAGTDRCYPARDVRGRNYWCDGHITGHTKVKILLDPKWVCSYHTLFESHRDRIAPRVYRSSCRFVDTSSGAGQFSQFLPAP